MRSVLQAVDFLQRGTECLGRSLALYGRRHDGYGDMGHAPLQGRQHVMQGGSAQRGDHTDTTHQVRQRAFALRIKKTLLLQARLDLHKTLKQGTLPSPPHRLDNQLQLAALLVHAQTPLELDLIPIARAEIDGGGNPLERGATDLPRRVLEIEIAVPAGGTHEAADLAAHPHRVELRLQTAADGLAQSPHLPQTQRRVRCSRLLFGIQSDCFL